MNLGHVILLDEAVEDLDLGRQFYDVQQKGIGYYFVTSVLSDIAALELYSGIHPTRYGYYRMLAKRFPFAIYYAIEANQS